YSTPEGAVREEAVRLRRVGGQTVPQVRGRVRWTSPEGRAFELRYEADENGYRVHPQSYSTTGEAAANPTAGESEVTLNDQLAPFDLAGAEANRRPQRRSRLPQSAKELVH
ncbi:Protein of unknown function, partial [Gryllus bimaculatus]